MLRKIWKKFWNIGKVALPTFFVLFLFFLGTWFTNQPLKNLAGDFRDFSEDVIKNEVMKDFLSLPALALEEVEQGYKVIDKKENSGPEITYNHDDKEDAEDQIENNPEDNFSFELLFNNDYQKGIEVDFGENRKVLLHDNVNKFSSSEIFSAGIDSNEDSVEMTEESTNGFFKKIISSFGNTDKEEGKYIGYYDNGGRKKMYYAYQKDGATGEKKLKNWLIYEYGSGIEEESYTIEGVKLQKNEDGEIEGYYWGQQEEQNELAMAEVDDSLLARAQAVLEKDLGPGAMLDDRNPDFIIPVPFYINNRGEKINLDWELDEETSTFSLNFQANQADYPIALDPTLQFSAPGINSSADVITGETTSNSFSKNFIAEDMNQDGQKDLIVGVSGYNSSTGRVYIFYNDGAYPAAAASADVIITGETVSSNFGYSLMVEDMNQDGQKDLIVGAYKYTSYTGRVYIFHNDGAYPAAAASADVIITGEIASGYFGYNFVAEDMNQDGQKDLIVGAYGYNSDTGRVYIFYNDGAYPAAAASADVIITGETTSTYFGHNFIAEDMNQDGQKDLIVGAYRYTSYTGRVYIFYNDGAYPAAAASADVIITGEIASGYFGYNFIAEDMNQDGQKDLMVGALFYNSFTGRVYIFYNDGAYPAAAASADVIITGETTSNFFCSNFVAEDMNQDGQKDLVVGAPGYNSSTGRVYIFYNDGAYPAAAASADVIITGETFSDNFGNNFMAEDMNQDGQKDFIVGAYGYNSDTGRTYIFYNQNGQLNTNKNITGDSSLKFGKSIITGDFNADGTDDLAVGAYNYNSGTGRVYMFYNDGQYPTATSSADVIITGEVTTDYFGSSLAAGDFNADGEIDLAVGANSYSSVGRVYIFYNDGSYPSAAASADVIITGEGTGDNLGDSLLAADLNADGKIDLAASDTGYDMNDGRVYVFYNDGAYPSAAASADVIITGEYSSNYFGTSLAAGDFNTDGEVDLAVGSYFISRAYIFYNDGSYPSGAASADVIITGSGYFGYSLAAGDFNMDGDTDLAVGAYGYSSFSGQAYVFYNDDDYPSAAASADVIIAGESGSSLGHSLLAGDFNADGRTDLAAGAYAYSSNTGRAYIFYNDGTYPGTAASADVIITGEATSNYFGDSFALGDLNIDGRVDLIIGAYGYSSNSGRVYFYETKDDYVWNLQPQVKSPRVLSGVGQELKITGEASSNFFGGSMVSGDFNADGKLDLVVGAVAYNSNTGRVYIFYNDGVYPSAAISADVIITGETTDNRFGKFLSSGDFNSDGKIDLVISSHYHNSNTGRVYIFYNDGAYPSGAASADIIITGETTNNYFGGSLSAGDFNSDGTVDIAVGASGYNSFAGRVYVFYNDGSYPSAAASADVIIDGEIASDDFGSFLSSGDFNADGETDLVVSDYSNSSTGRVCIFYNDGSYPSGAASADVIINGEGISNYFGYSLSSGDFNVDGKIDLVVSSTFYGSSAGRVYVFYNDGSYPSGAASADVIIDGEAPTNYFGVSLMSGDFNADGKDDLAASASSYGSSIGRAYIFYNDGAYPSAAASADVIMYGETTYNSFGSSLSSGDFNVDGKTDLAVGAYGYDSNIGRVYIYTFNDKIIDGETASDYFGLSLTSGDFNADGSTDLVVGAEGYNSRIGRAYIFYSDGVYPSTAASADVVITGEETFNYFGNSSVSGDFDADGDIDLVIGARGKDSFTGRVYIFYNDGTYSSSAASADVIITGETTSNYFGYSLSSGDFNADSKVDLAVGAYGYNSNIGRAYVFYNDGAYPSAAASADVVITGENTNDYFGYSMISGDFNADSKIDLVAGAFGCNSNTGQAYVFYNDGAYPSAAASADVSIVGETSSNYFSRSLVADDFNADGKVDLVIGSYYYNSGTGRAYIFYNDGSYPASAALADVVISGETTSNYFSESLASGDFNADGKIDLAVGAHGYNSFTGRAYIFYNDGTYPAAAASADVIMTGETTSNYFGVPLSSVDFNVDGKTDLVIGASRYNSSTGRVYIYITEVKKEDKVKGKIRRSGSFRGSVRIQ